MFRYCCFCSKPIYGRSLFDMDRISTLPSAAMLGALLLSWLTLGLSYLVYTFILRPRLFPRLWNMPGPDPPRGLLGVGGNLHDILQ